MCMTGSEALSHRESRHMRRKHRRDGRRAQASCGPRAGNRQFMSKKNNCVRGGAESDNAAVRHDPGLGSGMQDALGAQHRSCCEEEEATIE